MVKSLLLANVAVFVVQLLLDRSVHGANVIWSFALVPAEVTYGGKFWQLFTYQFLHGGPMHLLYNMLGLFFFGRVMEWHWGSRRFLAVYLLCGLAGGIAVWLLALRSGVPTVGASGAVLGILVAFGLTFPDEIIFLNFFIPMKAKWLVVLYAAFNLFGGIGGGRGVSYTGHLGGMLAGFLAWRWTEPWISRGRFRPPWSEKARRWRRRLLERRRAAPARRRERERERVDALLEKIGREGMDSLTAAERRFLEEAGGRDAE
jgi:membrane associated rhomboid family serine protease